MANNIEFNVNNILGCDIASQLSNISHIHELTGKVIKHHIFEIPEEFEGVNKSEYNDLYDLVLADYISWGDSLENGIFNISSKYIAVYWHISVYLETFDVEIVDKEFIEKTLGHTVNIETNNLIIQEIDNISNICKEIIDLINVNSRKTALGPVESASLIMQNALTNPSSGIKETLE